MEKKLYFKFSDNGEADGIVMTLDACMEWIKAEDLERQSESDLENYEYTLVPVLMTEEEFNALPEADF